MDDSDINALLMFQRAFPEVVVVVNNRTMSLTGLGRKNVKVTVEPTGSTYKVEVARVACDIHEALSMAKED